MVDVIIGASFERTSTRKLVFNVFVLVGVVFLDDVVVDDPAAAAAETVSLLAETPAAAGDPSRVNASL